MLRLLLFSSMSCVVGMTGEAWGQAELGRIGFLSASGAAGLYEQENWENKRWIEVKQMSVWTDTRSTAGIGLAVNAVGRIKT